MSITLEDNIPADVGDRVYNYYDMYPVTIVAIDPSGWCDTITDSGQRGPLLNGERMCSIETAIKKGWTA